MKSKQQKARYHLWKEAFEKAEFSLATAERLEKRHSRVFKNHAPKNKVRIDLADPSDDSDFVLVDGNFVSATEVTGTRVDNLNVGGLGHEECLFICQALREKACIEIMTVFGPMGAGGSDVAANDEAGVKTERDKLVADIAAELAFSEADIWCAIDQVKVIRNEVIAHRSGSGVAGVMIHDEAMPGGTTRGIEYTDARREVRYDRLHDICNVACKLTRRLVFQSET